MNRSGFILSILLLFASACATRYPAYYTPGKVITLERLPNRGLNTMSEIKGFVYSAYDSTFLDHVAISDNNGFIFSTDKEGVFSEIIKPGVYSFTFRSLGHDAFETKKIEFKPNQTLILVIKLGTSISH